MAISKKTMDRVRRIIAYMRTLPASANKHFDMRNYVEHIGSHSHQIDMSPTVEQLHACGTTACALGWACTMPYFKRLGLRLSTGWPGGFSIENDYEALALDPFGDGEAEDFWDALFGAHNKDRTPKEWAQRAEKVLRTWKWES